MPRVAHVRFLVVTRAHVSDHARHLSRLTSKCDIYGLRPARVNVNTNFATAATIDVQWWRSTEVGW